MTSIKMNVGQDSSTPNHGGGGGGGGNGNNVRDGSASFSNVIRVPPPVDVTNMPRSIADGPPVAVKNSALSSEVVTSQNLGGDLNSLIRSLLNTLEPILQRNFSVKFYSTLELTNRNSHMINFSFSDWSKFQAKQNPS